MNFGAPEPPAMRVLFDTAGQVAAFMLCRPPMSTSDDAMFRLIADAVEKVEADPGIAILRVCSDQQVVCAGADQHFSTPSFKGS